MIVDPRLSMQSSSKMRPLLLVKQLIKCWAFISAAHDIKFPWLASEGLQLESFVTQEQGPGPGRTAFNATVDCQKKMRATIFSVLL